MGNKRRLGLLLLFATGLMAGGCGGSSDDPATGTEGGKCYPNVSCNAGLVCLSQLCVDPDGGTDDTGGGADTAANHGSNCPPDCGEMVTVPGGSFMMGCNQAVDSDCSAAELPYHQVSVPAFEIDKTEVTVAAYKACVDAAGCVAPSAGEAGNWGVPGREQHPVNYVTWDQAGNYCQWAGKALCTEAQWEKAARGTTGWAYPWGNETATCEHAVWNEGYEIEGCGTGLTWPVGSKPKGTSPCGALDMAGNVSEWVQDWHHASYANAPTDGSPWETPSGTDRMARGGSLIDYTPQSLRAVSRGHADPSHSRYYLGIRCCRSTQF